MLQQSIMIDFQNSFIRLSPAKIEKIQEKVEPLLIEGESVFEAYSSIRDYVAFTNKRVIAVNVQGITGSKKSFTTLPYSRLISFAIETAGTFDMDSELNLDFSGLGKVMFEFSHGSNIQGIAQLIAKHLL